MNGTTSDRVPTAASERRRPMSWVMKNCRSPTHTGHAGLVETVKPGLSLIR
jgi:hypothetical protein